MPALQAVRQCRLLLHPHIVQLQEVFLTEHFLGIAMEYANGGDTFDYVVQQKGIQEPQARWLFQQLIIAIDYCHKKNIVNRDLKLENTLLHWHPGRSWPTLKLCDFGYSKNEDTQVCALYLSTTELRTRAFHQTAKCIRCLCVQWQGCAYAQHIGYA